MRRARTQNPETKTTTMPYNNCFRISNTLIILFILVFLIFISLVSGTSSDLSHTTNLPITSGVAGEREQGGVVTWDVTRRRRSFEVGRATDPNSTFILAQERTHRKDPLNGFKSYTGGWNIKDKHYYASVGFTAAPFFITALVWFVICGLSLFLICLCCCCCRKEPYGYSKTAYALSLASLIFFTLLAIAGCIVLYTGQRHFYFSTTRTLEYVVMMADTTAQNLRNVSDYLGAAKRIGVDFIVLPADIQKQIDDVMGTIQNAASILSDKTEENSRRIIQGLNIVKLALIVVSAVMLFLVFLGFLCSIFGMECIVYCLVILGWILVTGTFILCGVFLLIHNVFADACVSMDEWVQKNPKTHTALDDIITCVDKDLAQEALLKTKDVTYYGVFGLNQVVNSMSNVDPSAAPLINFNQSGAPLPPICNPFNPDRTDRKCLPGEMDLKDVTRVWEKHVCQVNGAGMCITPGRLTPTYYEQLSAAVNVSYALYLYGPFLVNLIDCTFVRSTFRDISNLHCPDLRKQSDRIYIGLLLISVAVMLSLIFWVIYARERRHRGGSKKILMNSF